jgi:putative ABC transport system ATP-binding protein
MSTALRADDISRTYSTPAGDVHALRAVSLAVEQGTLLAIVGPSGAGKTTLLNVLGALDAPTSGTLWYGDDNVTQLRDAALVEERRNRLGYVFQSFGLVPVLSAAENVELPLRIRSVPSAEREQRVANALELVGLNDHRDQRPYELSGGQQQRVGIARALAGSPSILLADEPTGQLDSSTAAAMMDLFVELAHTQNVATIVTTHDPAFIERADAVLELRDGAVVSRSR